MLLLLLRKRRLTLPAERTNTKKVYGDPQIHPQPESYWGNVNPIGPRACYDEGKRVAETMMYAYRNQSTCRAMVLFGSVGPIHVMHVCVLVGWVGRSVGPIHANLISFPTSQAA
jgi:hypothetical protein